MKIYINAFSMFFGLVCGALLGSSSPVFAERVVFDKLAVEERLESDAINNFNFLSAMPRGQAEISAILVAARKAAQIKTVPLSPAKVESILCEPARSGEDIPFVDCGTWDGDGIFDPEFFPFGLKGGIVLRDNEILLRKAFAIWSDPPARSSFVKWILSDILVHSKGRDGGREATLDGDQFVFSDDLMNSYFSKKLAGRDDNALGAKFEAIPNAVTVINGRIARLDAPYVKLINTLRDGSSPLIVDRSPFAERIGSHTFLVQLLFMNVSAQYGYSDGASEFSLNLLRMVPGLGQPRRWLAWGELFAFPEANSPRNVEYWKDVLPLRVRF